MYLRTLPNFEYFAPRTVKEACSLLLWNGDGIKILAGGTDLLVNMKYGTVLPQTLVGLKSISGLDMITFNETDGLCLGALSTHEAIAKSMLISNRYGALVSACSRIGTPQIRHMGTIGGNICNASPAADSLPPLIAFGAEVKLISLEGDRIIPLEAFFTGPGKSVLQVGEILSEIRLPCPAGSSGSAYVKLPARTSEDIAAVGVAVCVTYASGSDECRDIKIVLGAVAPTPVRVKEAEEILRGRRVGHVDIERAAQIAAERASPISDIRSSADYRKKMVSVLTEQAISQALGHDRSTFKPQS